MFKTQRIALPNGSHCGTTYRKRDMGILDRFQLNGKLALVTGSASGLGAAIAVALAEAGASVACHGTAASV